LDFFDFFLSNPLPGIPDSQQFEQKPHNDQEFVDDNVPLFSPRFDIPVGFDGLFQRIASIDDHSYDRFHETPPESLDPGILNATTPINR
jgi:hypothetical protein